MCGWLCVCVCVRVCLSVAAPRSLLTLPSCDVRVLCWVSSQVVTGGGYVGDYELLFNQPFRHSYVALTCT